MSPCESLPTSDQTGGQVVDDVSVQVGHDHDVELLRVGHQLHRRVVHDHRLELDVGVLLGDFFARPGICVKRDMCVVFCEDLFEVDLTGRQEIERLTTVLSLRLSFQM